MGVDARAGATHAVTGVVVLQLADHNRVLPGLDRRAAKSDSDFIVFGLF